MALFPAHVLLFSASSLNFPPEIWTSGRPAEWFDSSFIQI